MSSTSAAAASRPEEKRRDILHRIEGKHFGQCTWQLISRDRRMIVELLHWPKANSAGRFAVSVKHYESPIPTGASSKPYPDLAAHYCYIPLQDDGTWDGLDKSLTELERRKLEPGDKVRVKQSGGGLGDTIYLVDRITDGPSCTVREIGKRELYAPQPFDTSLLQRI